MSKIGTYLITIIANRPMACIAARGQDVDGHLGQGNFGRDRCESVIGVMTMFHCDMAWDTEIVVFTHFTSDELGLVEN
jgi:hypothetical protein